VAIIPARSRKPRDKAKAENGVLLVERWILARLRHHAFFRLGDLNTEIDTLLLALNRRPFRKLPGSRRSLFEQLDRPAMKPLPGEPYVFAEWQQPRVHIDYHVEVDRHYYSVPYALVSHVVDARVTAHTVELFYRGQRVASHVRSHLKGRYTTDPAHMPIRCRASGGGLPARARPRRSQLQERRVDFETWFGPRAITGHGVFHPGDPSRQRARRRLLPLTPTIGEFASC
jgi:transposase